MNKTLPERMSVILHVAFLTMLGLSTTGAGAENAAISIIPQPVKMETAEGQFVLNIRSGLVGPEKAMPVMQYMRQALAPATGFTLPIRTVTESKTPNILFVLKSELAGELGTEGYRLTITPDTALIEAAQPVGLFYGCQTLRQLLPVKIYQNRQVRDVQWTIPCMRITDMPRFPWRGMHLDVCRHFMPKEFVKKYIDIMAMHKMNTFHWHLTEDQGWRIEIKKYPKLTEVGAWRKETVVGKKRSNVYDGKPHGGFYTQDDVRDIVAYAKERFITVVPEIEMPGHAQAALASYPEFSCSGGPFEVLTDWVAGVDAFCAGNDQAIRFIQNILDEVLELFPSQYIHIGGDERPAEKWEKCQKCKARIKACALKDTNELQSWFIKQMDDYLTSKGRRLVGWDEILDGGLAPGATVMSWRGEEGGIAAAKAGHDVVMSPSSHTYFVYYQGDPNTEPFGYNKFVPLEKVYGYEPVPPTLTPQEAKHILGSQGHLWTEYMPNSAHVEYMAFPRACAIAEVIWTPKEQKNFDDFKSRLTMHLKRLDALNVNYRPIRK